MSLLFLLVGEDLLENKAAGRPPRKVTVLFIFPRSHIVFTSISFLLFYLFYLSFTRPLNKWVVKCDLFTPRSAHQRACPAAEKHPDQDPTDVWQDVCFRWPASSSSGVHKHIWKVQTANTWWCVAISVYRYLPICYITFAGHQHIVNVSRQVATPKWMWKKHGHVFQSEANKCPSYHCQCQFYVEGEIQFKTFPTLSCVCQNRSPLFAVDCRGL